MFKKKCWFYVSKSEPLEDVSQPDRSSNTTTEAHIGYEDNYVLLMTTAFHYWKFYAYTFFFRNTEFETGALRIGSHRTLYIADHNTGNSHTPPFVYVQY